MKSDGIRSQRWKQIFQGNVFAFTGNVEEDLLNITAVHPMREDAMAAFLGRAHAE